MTRLIISALFACLFCSAALAQPPQKHLLIYRTEQSARDHCKNDTIVWATRDRTRYIYQVTGTTICTGGMPANQWHASSIIGRRELTLELSRTILGMI